MARGSTPAGLARIDDTVSQAVAEGEVPGAVVLVARHGKIAFVKAFGRRAVEPHDGAMTRDTGLDMASLTEPMATDVRS